MEQQQAGMEQQKAGIEQILAQLAQLRVSESGELPKLPTEAAASLGAALDGLGLGLAETLGQVDAAGTDVASGAVQLSPPEKQVGGCRGQPACKWTPRA
jgi:hypothetical protein